MTVSRIAQQRLFSKEKTGRMLSVVVFLDISTQALFYGRTYYISFIMTIRPFRYLRIGPRFSKKSKRREKARPLV